MAHFTVREAALLEAVRRIQRQAEAGAKADGIIRARMIFDQIRDSAARSIIAIEGMEP